MVQQTGNEGLGTFPSTSLRKMDPSCVVAISGGSVGHMARRSVHFFVKGWRWPTERGRRFAPAFGARNALFHAGSTLLQMAV